MVYLISDKEGDLLEVLDFETDDKLKAYKQLNPSYIVKLADSETDDSFLIEEDEETFYEDDTLDTW